MVNSLSILGSTGSIGTQTLDVADKLNLKVSALTASTNIKLLEEQVRKYIDPFFGNIEHQPNGFEFRIQGSDNDRIIDNFNELYEYLKQEIQNSEYADSCKGLFLNTSDCPYLCKITMIDHYGNHINFAKMLSWYEINAVQDPAYPDQETNGRQHLLQSLGSSDAYF